MIGFGLLVGHLLGDYVLQNDWMARNKANPHPGATPSEPRTFPTVAGQDPKDAWSSGQIEWQEEFAGWEQRHGEYLGGHVACTVHCLLYTLSVWACSFWWMPWWGLAVCFLAHWPIDRFRLARTYMRFGQEAFATGPLAPWSVIVVDNTFHLYTLFLIGLSAGER